MEKFTLGYLLGWSGVAVHLANLPEWLWVPMYAFGCLLVLIGLAPGLADQHQLWADYLEAIVDGRGSC